MFYSFRLVTKATLIFIAFVESFPTVQDIHRGDYFDNMLRIVLWPNIAKEMQLKYPDFCL